MYKNVLASIPGIEYYPIVALVLFFGFFAALIIWFFRADKQRLAEQSMQVFEVDELDNSSTNVKGGYQRG